MIIVAAKPPNRVTIIDKSIIYSNISAVWLCMLFWKLRLSFLRINRDLTAKIAAFHLLCNHFYR
jgi:hypothetical protein